METFSVLLALCAGNSPVNSEFPAQRPVTRSFDVFLICTWINGWVNIREAGDLRRPRVHYYLTVMKEWWRIKSVNQRQHSFLLKAVLPYRTKRLARQTVVIARQSTVHVTSFHRSHKKSTNEHIEVWWHIKASSTRFITDSGHGLLHAWRQAIAWTNAALLSMTPLGTHFSEIWAKMQTFSTMTMHWKMESAICRVFHSSLNNKPKYI